MNTVVLSLFLFFSCPKAVQMPRPVLSFLFLNGKQNAEIVSYSIHSFEKRIRNDDTLARKGILYIATEFRRGR